MRGGDGRPTAAQDQLVALDHSDERTPPIHSIIFNVATPLRVAARFREKIDDVSVRGVLHGPGHTNEAKENARETNSGATENRKMPQSG
ncbi:hypothetical protein Aduo_015925 [Ancylostoma duodenale]